MSRVCLGGDCFRCGNQSVRKYESHGFCGWSSSMRVSDEERRERKGL